MTFDAHNILPRSEVKPKMAAVHTCCSKMEAVVQASGFSRHEEVAQDTQGDDEGQQHHRRNGQTYERPYTGT
jgi:hypothetical protein